METKVAYLSTSKLAAKYKKPVKEMFDVLLKMQLIERIEEDWRLTDKGERNGGVIKKHFKAGDYIAWEENRIEKVLVEVKDISKLLNATALSSHFSISRNKINPILAEIGFIEKSENGWVITKLGEKMGEDNINMIEQVFHLLIGMNLYYPIEHFKKPLKRQMGMRLQ
ncbi:hypothetical protein [Niallia nealsonii]|uniref:hypothetical protein n=1 Tax=Niallia nealsonii TaxID=115979 RepID=UPI001F2152E9|nr:hypothetical protein [Niallia nealsonii]